MSVRAPATGSRRCREKLTPKQNEIAVRILKEIRDRLTFLVDVGLEYLTLARASGTLSGGESQRIRLASQIGSGLTGVLYVLDEPSIGLHQRDNERLLGTLKRLRDLGNTVIVVEHDEDAILAPTTWSTSAPAPASTAARSWPRARRRRSWRDRSLTGKYLTGEMAVPIPPSAPQAGAQAQGSSSSARAATTSRTSPPRSRSGTFTCVTGVSGRRQVDRS